MTILPTLERLLPVGNSQRIFRFDNGFGASVVQGAYTYGGMAGLFELAVLRITGDGPDDYEITYDTGITEDVIGHLSEEEVQGVLAEIRDLPAEVIRVESTLGEVPALSSGEEAVR